MNVASAVGAGNDSDTATIKIASDCLLWSAQAFSVTTSPITPTPVTATAAVVQANSSGNTVVNGRGLAPTDAPTLQEQIQMIVQSEVIQNPSTSVALLTKQLVDSLPPSILPPSQAANIISGVVSAVVTPSQKTSSPPPPSPPAPLAPVLKTSFGMTAVALGSTTSLTFTVSNPNSSALTGIQLTDNLPSGLVVASPNGLGGSCLVTGLSITFARLTVVANPGSGSIGLSALNLPGNASCSLSLNVTAVALGTQNNVTSPVSSAQTGFGLSASSQIAVSKAVLTVTANSATIAVGAPLPVLSVSYAGFVNGDTSVVLSGAASLTTTATAAAPAGSYPITASLGTLAAANYSFNFVNGVLAITGPTAVDNSATFAAAKAAPNTILALFGTVLSCTPNPEVLVNGTASPILFSNATQINFVTPGGASAGTSATIEVVCNSTSLGMMTIPAAAVDPAVFSQTGTGSGPGSIVNQDGTVNTADKPASLNSYISVFVTGFGPFNAPSADGLQRLTYPVTAAIGGIPAIVAYAGDAPGETSGLQQINIQIPAIAPAGPKVPITLAVDGVSTQTGITVAIQ